MLNAMRFDAKCKVKCGKMRDEKHKNTLKSYGGITKRENEVKSMALVFSELRKGVERRG